MPEPRRFPDPPPFVPRSERQGRPSKWRDIACRRCAAPTTAGDDGYWYHADGTPACVDPVTLAPYPDVDA